MSQKPRTYSTSTVLHNHADHLDLPVPSILELLDTYDLNYYRRDALLLVVKVADGSLRERRDAFHLSPGETKATKPNSTSLLVGRDRPGPGTGPPPPFYSFPASTNVCIPNSVPRAMLE